MSDDKAADKKNEKEPDFDLEKFADELGQDLVDNLNRNVLKEDEKQ